MKIFNKFIWSKKEPSNKNDIWFDGSTWRMYTEEAWQSFTLPVDAADKVAKVIENASEVYQEKLNAGYGIIIEGNTISVDDSNVWEAIETLQQNKVEQIHLNDYVPLDRWASTSQVLIENISELNSTKLNKTDVATINGKSLIEGGNIVIDDTEIKQQITELSAETEVLKEAQQFTDVAIKDLQDMKIDRENDDYYPKMAVGLADNLAGVDVVDSEVNFRRSGGGAISDGVARIEAIKGNSVVWNQLFTLPYATMTSSGVTVSKNADNSLTCVGTLTDTYFNFGQFQSNIENHKYLFILYASAALNGYNFGLLNRNAQMIISGGFAYVFHTNSDISKGKYIGIRGLSVGNEINENLLVLQIDLTKAFPNDWQNINTIEEFYARIPMGVDLNAYNEGEVIHMDVQSIESQGVNAWDEEWEVGEWSIGTGEAYNNANAIRSKNYIPVVGGQQYKGTCIKGNNVGIVLYDAEFKHLTGAVNSITTPSNACYAKIFAGGSYGNVYNHDICINISDTSINGKYFPYIKRVEDLSIIRKYFPNGMKSAGSAYDEIRYNKATQKWEYSEGRLKSVDLGSLTWNYYSSSNTSLFKAQFADIKIASSNDVANMLCAPYTANNANAWQGDKTITATPLSGVQIWIHDEAYKDNLEAFKAAIQGVILYYEPNDWEWVELDAEDQFKDLDYQVWNAGTEKAIAEGKSAPLAADITYGFNAIGKIKELESLVAALRAKVGI